MGFILNGPHDSSYIIRIALEHAHWFIAIGLEASDHGIDGEVNEDGIAHLVPIGGTLEQSVDGFIHRNCSASEDGVHNDGGCVAGNLPCSTTALGRNLFYGDTFNGGDGFCRPILVSLVLVLSAHLIYSPYMSDSNQSITEASALPDIVAYYSESVHSAHLLLKNAVNGADGDFQILNENLKGVNAFIKAKKDIGGLLEKLVSSRGPEVSWDPFSSEDNLDDRLQVVHAKAEFTAITNSEDAAVALYKAGLTYNEISDNTGLGKKDIKSLVRKQGIERQRKKAVPVLK